MRHETVEQEVDVTELQIGMHVIRLDRPWEETDFPLQGFVIQTRGDIDALQGQCRRVTIEGKIRVDAYSADPTKVSQRKEKPTFFKVSQPTRRNASKPQKTQEQAPHGKVSRRVTYINQVDVNSEMSRAPKHYETVKDVARDIMSGIRVGRALDLNKARQVVDNCIDSILRNDDALLLLTKLKHKDEYTAEHSLNVSILSATFGKHLGLLEDEIRTLGLCGLLHDIGKAKVPVEIIQKPGALSPKENEIMRQHADWGRDILMSLPTVVHATIDVAYNHHERLDGKGYPRGLEGYQIPYFAKIVSIVDTYDAITSSRVYDRGRSSMEALQIIHKFRGTQFDPDLTREFVKMIGIYPPGSIVELESGEAGIIVASNPNNRRKPKLMMVRDANKQKPKKYRMLDLSRSPLNAAGAPFKISKEIPEGTYGIKLQRFLDAGLVLGHQTVDETSV